MPEIMEITLLPHRTRKAVKTNAIQAIATAAKDKIILSIKLQMRLQKKWKKQTIK